MKLSILILLLTVILVYSQTAKANDTTTLWPLPISYSYNPNGQNITINPCQVKYIAQGPNPLMISQTINYYLTKFIKCEITTNYKVIMNIFVRSADVKVPTETAHEAYSITLRQNYKWEIVADYFPGFLRGYETFMQLFETNNQEDTFIKGLPVLIDDAPQFKWRGIMIDTSRHFLPISTIKKTIDILQFNKMNVLHWHITDQDSFPIVIPKHPQISQAGKLSGQYNLTNIQDIVTYAENRGIRVIPEIDTPAHSQSWGRSNKYKDIVVNCDDTYYGQLDPTLPLTMQVVTDVLSYINTSFKDSYVHFGGDEVDYDCWDQRPSIMEYMNAWNISDYFGLSVDFRQRQKIIWRNISKTKKVIYWANEDIDLPLQDDDVLQWWGVSANVDQIVGRKNEVILSNYDLTYLDKGFGELDGLDDPFIYQHWRMMYNFQPRIDKVNVIGGQVCMWDEVGNQYTHQQKVTQRSNILGQRLWNDKIDIHTNLNNIAARLVTQTKRLRSRGIKVWPVTVGLCEQTDISICFH